MDLGLTGRVAAVAASSSGLGLAVARQLAAEGADVALCARDPERLARAHAEVDAAGPGRVISSAVDLRDDGAAAGWVSGAAGQLGGLHVLVTNCGGVPHGPADAFTAADYRRAIDSCMMPHVSLALAALPHLTAAGWGRILIVTSEAVRQPIPDTALSAVARMGLLGFAKGLVHALGARGVTVNVLAPGFHRTAALDEQFGANVDRAVAEVANGLPLGRLGQAADFGALAAFLASDQASYVTGTVLLADGGATRGI
jgi:3-oxoacyl-[acyl-carrier protein] reductase